MPLDLNRCSASYCRKPSDIIVLGVPYCPKHNEERVEVAYVKAVARMQRKTKPLNNANAIERARA